jgi:hypothetical protein
MAREVEEEECLRVSGDPNEFLRLIGKAPAEGDTSPSGRQKPGGPTGPGGLHR